MENSTDSTVSSKCSTVLLKADTGADVNLMNKQTFDQLFGKTKAKDLLQPTPIRMENYGNTAVKVPCISILEGQGLQASFLHY